MRFEMSGGMNEVRGVAAQTDAAVVAVMRSVGI